MVSPSSRIWCHVELPTTLLVESILLVLIAPHALGDVTPWELLRWRRQQCFTRGFLPKLSPLSIVLLSLTIGTIFTSQGGIIVENPRLLALMEIPVITFYTINLGVGFAVGGVVLSLALVPPDGEGL
jgi:ACR3 family arsenite transporter